MIWSQTLPLHCKAWKDTAAGSLSPGGPRPGVHLIGHLVAFWYRHGLLFQSGVWLVPQQGPPNRGSLLPREKHSGLSKFYSSQPGDIQALDGGSSGAHVVTLAQTYTYTTRQWCRDAQVVMKPAHRGTPHHGMQTHRDAGGRSAGGGGRQGQLRPSSTVHSSPWSSLSLWWEWAEGWG